MATFTKQMLENEHTAYIKICVRCEIEPLPFAEWLKSKTHHSKLKA